MIGDNVPEIRLDRRQFGRIVAGAVVAASRSCGASVHVSGPSITHGVSSGDVIGGKGVVWARTDRPARMIVEWATTDSFQNARKVVGPAAVPETDFTAKSVLTGLPPGQTIVYRASFRDLDSARTVGEPSEGRFKTPSTEKNRVRIAWGGDVAGQGWGIDPNHGGMAIFDAIRAAEPDVFVHSGDHIYADNPILSEVKLDDGTLWKNLVTEATSKVAETLDEFRGRYRYNLADEPFRRFLAEVPMLAQWDDHEVRNNWYPGQILDDPRYSVRSVDLLAARAKRAFFDYLPLLGSADDVERVYRVASHGPLLDVFLLDERSYRGANSPNRQTEDDASSAFLGPEQWAWLKRSLAQSKAVWKVIASDMPIGLVVRDGKDHFEAFANGDNGPPSGREREIAELLRFIKTANVQNTVWLTADVHYAAAHHYDPTRAAFTDFDPFWEFVAGPLHAGTFGSPGLDLTFGPEVKFSSIPPDLKPNRPPSEGLQFFGTATIDPKTAAMTVALHDRAGKSIYSVDLAAI